MKAAGGYNVTLPPERGFNERGRAIPDLSANAFSFYTALTAADAENVGGTSGATPVVRTTGTH
eukprot:COSAG01_NODE_5498_length_4224_cov_2.723152_2_plen_63_part_00